MKKLKLWHRCVIAFILIHWALFLILYFILQRELGVPQFMLSALEVPLAPFLLVGLTLKYMPFPAGSALERAAAIIVPTVFYAIIGLVVGLVIEKMRKGRVKRVIED